MTEFWRNVLCLSEPQADVQHGLAQDLLPRVICRAEICKVTGNRGCLEGDLTIQDPREALRNLLEVNRVRSCQLVGPVEMKFGLQKAIGHCIADVAGVYERDISLFGNTGWAWAPVQATIRAAPTESGPRFPKFMSRPGASVAFLYPEVEIAL